MIGAARLECGEPAAESGELIRRQLGNRFGNFFDFHVAQYSTAEAWLREVSQGGGAVGYAKSPLEAAEPARPQGDLAHAVDRWIDYVHIGPGSGRACAQADRVRKIAA